MFRVENFIAIERNNENSLFECCEGRRTYKPHFLVRVLHYKNAFSLASFVFSNVVA